MSVCLVTGSAGLIGSESVRFFSDKGLQLLGVDNDMRRSFFGEGASTKWNLNRLKEAVPSYRHYDIDIRDKTRMQHLFQTFGTDIAIIIHAAAQPSHDWAATSPMIDFEINATSTLMLLELARQYCPECVFIFTSTNKVYGDTPNRLPLVEQDTRYEIDASHRFFDHGIDETMSIDHSKHSLFGVSKVAADLMVQEYGRYFGLKTACFRCGCLTGSNHSGTELHGFLSYLVNCAVHEKAYTILGYKGKQVRDNIHSYDLVNMFWHFFRAPHIAAVYNVGGGRHSNCSILEAVAYCEEVIGKKMDCSYIEDNRKGDHIWWISDNGRFQKDYPGWSFTYDLERIMLELINGARLRGHAS
jgi:CDP-paratose 2-epimerase